MTPPAIPFIKGRPFTLVSISSMMAHTTKDEIFVTSLLEKPVFRPKYSGASTGSWRFGTLKLKGKRKEFYLDVSPDTLVFSGHGAVLVDGDVSLSPDGNPGFTGNACFNLCGTVAEVRDLIATNLNPQFTARDSIIAIPPGDEKRTWYDRKRETLAFEDLESNHAVVNQIKAKAATANIVPFPTAPALSPNIAAAHEVLAGF